MLRVWILPISATDKKTQLQLIWNCIGWNQLLQYCSLSDQLFIVWQTSSIDLLIIIIIQHLSSYQQIYNKTTFRGVEYAPSFFFSNNATVVCLDYLLFSVTVSTDHQMENMYVFEKRLKLIWTDTRNTAVEIIINRHCIYLLQTEGTINESEAQCFQFFCRGRRIENRTARHLNMRQVSSLLFLATGAPIDTSDRQTEPRRTINNTPGISRSPVRAVISEDTASTNQVHK